jgi:hypothetical protein
MMGQTTVVGNALNLGSLRAPSAASLVELEKLFAAKRYAEALAQANALLAKDPTNAELLAWKKRIVARMGSR